MSHFRFVKQLKRASEYKAILGCLLFIISPANADTIKVAVTANFHFVMESLKERFQSRYGHTLELHYGTSGELKRLVSDDTQKFDLFLSADNLKTAELERQHKILENSRTVYAQGLLAFWHGQWGPLKPEDIESYLTEKTPPAIHIADPKDTPYLQAAVSALQNYNLYETLKDQGRLMVSDHISKAWTNRQNAYDAGFMPFSMLKGTNFDRLLFPVSITLVPQSLYPPLVQELVILRSTEHEAAAKALVEYLLCDETQKFIAVDGGYQRARVEKEKAGLIDPLIAYFSVHGTSQFLLVGVIVSVMGVALVELLAFLPAL
ncbi:molybdate ABC transporter substrate-binding protein [Endozoicomonas sp. 4G]|uniref:molybdate ABC transporter substrate-binding protein n=1 Tax=Endozoicomonas sp. 4G TaxID=2872754 RepID=UPI002078659F|nr:molybdate ABC transporter substrate-binding protein [Endozoicomonas sp. 4G]